jgi:hypothetical protein
VDFHEITGLLVQGVFGEFHGLRLESEPTLIFHGHFDKGARELFQHELTHRFVAFYYPNAPTWLNEGLAEFFSTLEIGEQRITLGAPIERTVGVRMRPTESGLETDGGWPTLAVLRSMDQARFYAPMVDDAPAGSRHANYVAAWALVHTLATEGSYRDRFAEYLRALSGAGVRGGSASAWQQAFPPQVEGALEQSYRRKLVAREVKVLEVPKVEHSPGRVQVRTLAPAEVHVLWARTRGAAYTQMMEADLANAAAQDGSSVEVLLAQGVFHLHRGEVDEAGQHFERARLLAPDDTRCLQAGLWHEMLQVDANGRSGDAPERMDLLAARLSERAETTGQYMLLARRELMAGRYDEGISWIRKTLAEDSFCAGCWAVASELYEGTGDLVQAHRSARIAVGLMPEGRAPQPWLSRVGRLATALAQLEDLPIGAATGTKDE